MSWSGRDEVGLVFVDGWKRERELYAVASSRSLGRRCVGGGGVISMHHAPSSYSSLSG